MNGIKRLSERRNGSKVDTEKGKFLGALWSKGTGKKEELEGNSRNLLLPTVKTPLERGEFQGPSNERLIRRGLFIARSCVTETALFAPSSGGGRQTPSRYIPASHSAG